MQSNRHILNGVFILGNKKKSVGAVAALPRCALHGTRGRAAEPIDMMQLQSSGNVFLRADEFCRVLCRTRPRNVLPSVFRIAHRDVVPR